MIKYFLLNLTMLIRKLTQTPTKAFDKKCPKVFTKRTLLHPKIILTLK